MAVEWMQPMLKKLGKSWKIILASFLAIGLGIVSIRYFTVNEPCECDGTFQNPINTTFYRNKLVDPVIENYSRLEQILYDEMPNIYNRSRTLIFDCPTGDDDPPSINNTLYTHAFIQALAGFNQENKPPMNFWLRLAKESNNLEDFIFCTDLAILGNKMHPGTIRGILGNSQIAMGVVSVLVRFKLPEKYHPCTMYTAECFEILKVQGLKFGLMMNPVNCPNFPNIIKHSIIRKFDEIFYFDEVEHAQLTFGENNVPTLTVSSSDFNRCKKHIAEMVKDAKTVKYVIAEKYLVHQPWEISPYPYCLKFV